jgi:MGT family glycosyltransferase
MGRLVAYTAPVSGHTFPSTAMLLELHRRGHEVHVRTRASDIERLQTLGLSAAPVDPRIEALELDDWKAPNPIAALQRLQRWYQTNAKVEVGDLRGAIDDVRPDALIVDANFQGGAAVAEASGLPWCQYSPFPPVFQSKDAPPYGPGLPPARGLPGRARDRALYAIFGRLADHYLPPINALRAGLGLEPLRHLEDLFLRARRFILFTAEPYEYPRSDWPESVRLVGPLTWEPPASPPSWLNEETRPIVLVTTSTVYQRDDKLIATALEALADERVAVIATTAALDPTAFNAPANARVEAFLPHGPILERAACVICHGGMGITQKALAIGVPVCVVPFCRDQFEVARRVEVSNAGTRLHHKRLTAQRLRKAVHANDPHAARSRTRRPSVRPGRRGTGCRRHGRRAITRHAQATTSQCQTRSSSGLTTRAATHARADDYASRASAAGLPRSLPQCGRNWTLIRAPRECVVLGIACCHVRWQLPPITSRSPCPIWRRSPMPPDLGRSANGLVAPSETIATIVSFGLSRAMRSPCQATLSLPSRYKHRPALTNGSPNSSV